MQNKLFGYAIKNTDDKSIKSFIQPNTDDGAVEILSPSSGTFSDTFIDMEGSAKGEAQLVTRYRNMDGNHEVAKAVDDIVNEAIIYDEMDKIITINMDNLEVSKNIKNKIDEEFDNVLDLLDFNRKGHDIFRRFYVDGRLYYNIVVDDTHLKNGIQELRYIDPRKIRKIREIETKRDPETRIITKSVKSEYYLYNDNGYLTTTSAFTVHIDGPLSGMKISKDAIAHVTSGLINETNTLVLSYLHKAIKPLNQLRMLEDASVIYRLSRAPERRIFYIDIGNLPKAKGEEYLREQMVRHKNRLIYDAVTGEIKNDKKFMNLLEDFWIPRRGGGKGTEITTLAGGQNLGEIEDIVYFQKKLFNSLSVPVSRLEPDNMFSLGRAQEISRDEIKFSKFIEKLRTRFSSLFDSILQKQLILKGIIRPEDWIEMRKKITFNFMHDNHYEEIKESEVLRERLNTLQSIQDYVGTYYSMEWVRKHILRLTDEDIQSIAKQVSDESSESNGSEDSTTTSQDAPPTPPPNDNGDGNINPISPNPEPPKQQQPNPKSNNNTDQPTK